MGNRLNCSFSLQLCIIAVVSNSVRYGQKSLKLGLRAQIGSGLKFCAHLDEMEIEKGIKFSVYVEKFQFYTPRWDEGTTALLAAS